MKEIQLRPLGNTGLQVTPLGLGLAALGRPGYINLGHAADLDGGYNQGIMQAHAGRVLDAAFQAGVRYFDAARSYGRAEAFLSSWLQQRAIDPGALVVGSKWGYRYTAGWQVTAEKHEIKEHSLEMLRRQWQESHALLGEHLNLYQVHSATLESGILDDKTVHSELARMKAYGLAIGLTVSGPQQAQVIEQAAQIRVDGVRLFDCVQATWNLLERSAGAALREAHADGIGVIVKEALANGRLTPRNHNAEFQGKRQRLETEAHRLGVPMDALALSAVLAQPWVDVVLSGAAREEHLLSNLKALEAGYDEQADANLGELVESPGMYWEKRANLPWN